MDWSPGLVPRLRFDVLTKTKQPELHRYWTTRDRAANLRLFRLVSEVLHALAAGAFHPVVGWHCQACPYPGVGVKRKRTVVSAGGRGSPRSDSENE